MDLSVFKTLSLNLNYFENLHAYDSVLMEFLIKFPDNSRMSDRLLNTERSIFRAGISFSFIFKIISFLLFENLRYYTQL